jgi:DNA polymerase III delta subunit
MLLLIHGTDSYRIQEAVEEVIAHHRAKTTSTPEVVRIDCADETATDELHRQLKYPSFFGESRLVVASHAAQGAMGEILNEYNLADIEDIIVIATQDTSEKGYDKKMLARLKASSHTTQELQPRTGAPLSAWLQRYCAHAQASLSHDAAAYVVRLVGSDTRTLVHELDKLIAYAHGEPISKTMAELLISPRIERDEWELSNALAAHDKRSLVAALWKKLHEGTPEQLLMGSLAAGFRNLIMVKDLLKRNHASAGIAKATGLHPFVVSKTLSGARTADSSRLARAHIALALLDRGAKDGRMDMTDGLFSILLAL